MEQSRASEETEMKFQCSPPEHGAERAVKYGQEWLHAVPWFLSLLCTSGLFIILYHFRRHLVSVSSVCQVHVFFFFFFFCKTTPLGWALGLVIERLRVRIPAGAAGEFSSSELTFCFDTYSVCVPPPVIAVTAAILPKVQVAGYN